MRTFFHYSFSICMTIVLVGALIHILGWIFISLFPVALAFIGGCLAVVVVVSAYETRKRRNGK